MYWLKLQLQHGDNCDRDADDELLIYEFAKILLRYRIHIPWFYLRITIHNIS